MTNSRTSTLVATATAIAVVAALATQAHANHISVFEKSANLTYFALNKANKDGCGVSAAFITDLYLAFQCLPENSLIDDEPRDGLYYKIYETTTSISSGAAQTTFLVRDYYQDPLCSTWEAGTYYTDDCYVSTRSTVATTTLSVEDTGIAATEAAGVPTDKSTGFADLSISLFKDLVPFKDTAASDNYFVALDATSYTFVDSTFEIGQQLIGQHLRAFMDIPYCYGIAGSVFLIAQNNSEDQSIVYYQYGDSQCAGSSTYVTDFQYQTGTALGISHLFSSSVYASYISNTTTETLTSATTSYDGYANTELYLLGKSRTILVPTGSATATRAAAAAGTPKATSTQSSSAGNGGSTGLSVLFVALCAALGAVATL